MIGSDTSKKGKLLSLRSLEPEELIQEVTSGVNVTLGFILDCPTLFPQELYPIFISHKLPLFQQKQLGVPLILDVVLSTETVQFPQSFHLMFVSDVGFQENDTDSASSEYDD